MVCLHGRCGSGGYGAARASGGTGGGPSMSKGHKGGSASDSGDSDEVFRRL